MKQLKVIYKNHGMISLNCRKIHNKNYYVFLESGWGVWLMNYFYAIVFIEIIFWVFYIYKIGTVLKLFRKERKKIYLVLIIILVPLGGSLFYNITLPKIEDIKYALNEKLLVYEGTVQKTYMTGWPNSFILDGKEYQYNPWEFKPIEKSRYKLYYLHSSKFVVRYEKK